MPTMVHYPRLNVPNGAGGVRALPGGGVVAGDRTPELARAEVVLRAWRLKAADALLVLIALAAAGSAAAWVLNHDLPGSSSHRVPTASFYVLVMAMAAAIRGHHHEARVWLMLSVLYLSSLQGLLMYDGAMARVWLLIAPIVALLLVGPRSGRVAAAISVVLILLHTAGVLTGVTDRLRVPGFDSTLHAVVVYVAIMWLGALLPLLMLVERFHLWHAGTLATALGTADRLEDEAAQRRVADALLAKGEAERERLEQEIARVGDDERRRLGHDLHDGVSQQLTGALLRCTALEERLTAEGSEVAADARALGALLESTMDEVQEVARSLSPVEMEPDALGPALGALSRRAGANFSLPCEYRQEGDVRLPDREQTLHLYRIAQEALNNAGKHARASRIGVTLMGADGHVLLTVEDDGSGMPAPAPPRPGGLGLRIMAFRAQKIGGTLTIDHPPQGGTRVLCEVPRGGTGVR
jgi:signal transduction histidine kinase